MLETGTSILKTFRLAFAATDNAAFVSVEPFAQADLRRGNTITDSLATTRIFPETYLSALLVGEESGHMPEVLRQQAEFYDEIARRRMSLLNKLLGWAVWLVVAAFVTSAIFQIFTVAYLGQINKIAG